MELCGGNRVMWTNAVPSSRFLGFDPVTRDDMLGFPYTPMHRSASSSLLAMQKATPSPPPNTPSSNAVCAAPPTPVYLYVCTYFGSIHQVFLLLLFLTDFICFPPIHQLGEKKKGRSVMVCGKLRRQDYLLALLSRFHYEDFSSKSTKQKNFALWCGLGHNLGVWIVGWYQIYIKYFFKKTSIFTQKLNKFHFFFFFIQVLAWASSCTTSRSPPTPSAARTPSWGAGTTWRGTSSTPSSGTGTDTSSTGINNWWTNSHKNSILIFMC